MLHVSVARGKTSGLLRLYSVLVRIPSGLKLVYTDASESSSAPQIFEHKRAEDKAVKSFILRLWIYQKEKATRPIKNNKSRLIDDEIWCWQKVWLTDKRNGDYYTAPIQIYFEHLWCLDNWIMPSWVLGKPVRSTLVLRWFTCPCQWGYDGDEGEVGRRLRWRRDFNKPITFSASRQQTPLTARALSYWRQSYSRIFWSRWLSDGCWRYFLGEGLDMHHVFWIIHIFVLKSIQKL